MRIAVTWLLTLLVALSVACGGVGTPTPAPAAPAVDQGPVQQAGDPTPLQLTFAILLELYVDPVDSAAVLRAGLENLRTELQQSGVVAPEVAIPSFTGDAEQDWTLFQAAFDDAVNRYSSKLSRTAMSHAAIRGMAASVDDCHTTFLEPQEFEEQMQRMRGEMRFGGIGAALRKPSDTDPLVIWHVYADTPAAQAGVQAGDVVLAVDGQDVTSLSISQAVDLIRGPEGAPVDLTVRKADGTEQVYRIVRAAIQPPSAEGRVLDGGIGYLQIYDFPLVVTGQVDSVLAEFQRQGIRGMIVDVRNNGGGALEAGTQVLSRFVREGLLFYVWDRSNQREDYVADGQSYRGLDVPTVVLVNEATGSGGEIFAAALQEIDQAMVIGTRTSGCVGTGRIYPLGDGSAMQVTVGRLLTGQENRVLNRIGLVPDESVPMGLSDITAGRDPQLERAVAWLSAQLGP